VDRAPQSRTYRRNANLDFIRPRTHHKRLGQVVEDRDVVERNAYADLADLAWLKAYDLERLKLGRWLASIGGVGDVDLWNRLAAPRTNVSDAEGQADAGFSQLGTKIIKVEGRVTRLAAPRSKPRRHQHRDTAQVTELESPIRRLGR
jgi:hypothetical protein